MIYLILLKLSLCMNRTTSSKLTSSCPRTRRYGKHTTSASSCRTRSRCCRTWSARSCMWIMKQHIRRCVLFSFLSFAPLHVAPPATSRPPLYSTLYRLSTNTDGLLLYHTGASKTTITKFLVLYEIYSPFCLPFYFTVLARFSVVTIYLDPCCYFSSFFSHICYAVGQCFYPGAVRCLTLTPF